MYRLKTSFPRLNIHQSRTQLKMKRPHCSSAAASPSCYAHINDEDNSLGVIPNLLTRSLCRPFSQSDAHDGDVLSANPPERRDGWTLQKEKENPQVVTVKCALLKIIQRKIKLRKQEENKHQPDYRDLSAAWHHVLLKNFRTKRQYQQITQTCIRLQHNLNMCSV